MIKKSLPKIGFILISAAVLVGCESAGNIDLSRFLTDAQPSPTAAPTPNPENEQTVSGQLKDVLAQNQSMQCEFTRPTNEGRVEGTVYVADSNFRVDSRVISDQDNTTVDMYLIGNDEWVYHWTSILGTGLQVRTDAVMNAGEELNQNLAQQERMQALSALMQDMDYTCNSWESDQARFQLPEDTNFTDITSFIQGMGTQQNE